MKILKEYIYYVKGMHCASCEILIEKKLLEIKNIKTVEASVQKGTVLIEYDGERPSIAELNKIFEKEGYKFSDSAIKAEVVSPKSSNFKIIIIALGIIMVFIILNRLGLSSFVNINSRSALPAFFLFGILAGLSTCAALVGGIILSMSKQWLQAYSEKDSIINKLQPHLMFNIGRLVTFAIFGAVLGGIGSKLQFSFTFTSILVIGISLLMFFLGLQMLGARALQRFQIAFPKFITRRIADESKFNGRFMPILMGGFTFFLPCGFTITAQSIALLSGNILQGGLIMFFFALGTFFPLLAIGLSSVKLSQKPHLSGAFLKVAGILVLFFAFFNINSQLNILGMPSLNNLLSKTNSSVQNTQQNIYNDLAPIVDGKQVLAMNASSSGYKPNYFKVRAGIPVRWEITDVGTSGCTNAVISRSLFDGQINLTPGQVSVKEFTPTKAGKYKFSCWMGMISGVIEVVDQDVSPKSAASIANNVDANNDSVISSGSAGCGCGGGSGRGESCSIK